MVNFKKSKKAKLISRDPQKEKKFKDLVDKLATQGLEVRREKLKQGFGFKVVSGSCELNGQKIIFIDQRMTQDDQLTFLSQFLDATPERLLEQLPSEADDSSLLQQIETQSTSVV